MCCEPIENDNPVVGECPECGGPVDANGDTTETKCGYSPLVCSKCGYKPCDWSC